MGKKKSLKKFWFPLLLVKPGQLNARIISFTIMDEFWAFTHAKIPLKSMERFPCIGKLVQLHKFCLYWAAMIQKMLHVRRQTLFFFFLNIFNNRLNVEGFVSDMWKSAQGRVCDAGSQLQVWALTSPMYMLHRDAAQGNGLPMAERRRFGGCHVPVSLFPPTGLQK